jgi:hypothetical protein
MAEAPILVRCGTVPSYRLLRREHLMPRYVFAVRHSAFTDVQDDAAGMELPDDAAAREFAAKVMRGLSAAPGRRLGGLDNGSLAGRYSNFRSMR